MEYCTKTKCGEINPQIRNAENTAVIRERPEKLLKMVPRMIIRLMPCISIRNAPYQGMPGEIRYRPPRRSVSG